MNSSFPRSARDLSRLALCLMMNITQILQLQNQISGGIVYLEPAWYTGLSLEYSEPGIRPFFASFIMAGECITVNNFVDGIIFILARA